MLKKPQCLLGISVSFVVLLACTDMLTANNFTGEIFATFLAKAPVQTDVPNARIFESRDKQTTFADENGKFFFDKVNERTSIRITLQTGFQAEYEVQVKKDVRNVNVKFHLDPIFAVSANEEVVVFPSQEQAAPTSQINTPEDGALLPCISQLEPDFTCQFIVGGTISPEFDSDVSNFEAYLVTRLVAPVAEPYKIASQALEVDQALGTFKYLTEFVDSSGRSIAGQQYDVGVLIVDEPGLASPGTYIDLSGLSGLVSVSSMVSFVTDYRLQGEALIASVTSPLNETRIACDTHTDQNYICPISASGKVDISRVDANALSTLYVTSRIVYPVVEPLSLYPQEVIFDQNTGFWNSSIDLELGQRFTGENVVVELALVLAGARINSSNVLSFESFSDIPDILGTSESITVVVEP